MSVFLPWTTRGVDLSSRSYLASASFELDEPLDESLIDSKTALDPDTPLTHAIPAMADARLRASQSGPPLEYGSFHHDGTLLATGLRMRRQMRNILYYTHRDLYNLSRGRTQDFVGSMLGQVDRVANPAGQWAVLVTDACPDKERVLSALRPLIEHRNGETIEVPRTGRIHG